MRVLIPSSPRIMTRASALGLFAAICAVSPIVGAQTAAVVAVHDARWQPWLGCWKPTGAIVPVVSAGESVSPASATMICVVPGPALSSVEIVNFAGGSITDRTVINPGVVTSKKSDECVGTETATWSADGRRLMLKGTFSCGRGVDRVESGVMSIDADGQWVQAQSVNVNKNVTTFIAHFRDTGIALEGIAGGAIVERPILDVSGKRLSPPRDGCRGADSQTPSADGQRISVKSDYTCSNGLHRVADAEFGRDRDGQWIRVNGPSVFFGTASVRAFAGAPVTTQDVLEVSKAVDANLTEAWLTDRGQGFELTGKELVRLADGGMPSRVIDMLVAISNPKTFVLQRNDGTPNVNIDRLAPSARGATTAENSCASARGACYGMTGLGWLYGADRYYGWNPYGYQYDMPFYRYGYGYGYGNGYPGYGYGGYSGPGYYSGNGPVVVVVSPGGNGSAGYEPRGKAVYGQGYTRSEKSIPFTPPPSSSGGGSPGSSGSGGSSVGGSSSGGSSAGEARTAKPRGGGQ